MLSAARLAERSSAVCSVASWHDQVYVAWTGTDLHLNLGWSADGRGLAGKRRLAYRSFWHVRRTDPGLGRLTMETAGLGPSLAAGQFLHLAWTGSSGSLRLLASTCSPAAARPAPPSGSTMPGPPARPRSAATAAAWSWLDRH